MRASAKLLRRSSRWASPCRGARAQSTSRIAQIRLQADLTAAQPCLGRDLFRQNDARRREHQHQAGSLPSSNRRVQKQRPASVFLKVCAFALSRQARLSTQSQSQRSSVFSAHYFRRRSVNFGAVASSLAAPACPFRCASLRLVAGHPKQVERSAGSRQFLTSNGPCILAHVVLQGEQCRIG